MRRGEPGVSVWDSGGVPRGPAAWGPGDRALGLLPQVFQRLQDVSLHEVALHASGIQISES